MLPPTAAAPTSGITARKDRAVTAAISAIPADSWIKIRYPKAIFNEELNQWVSDAEVAEIGFTLLLQRESQSGRGPG